MTHTDAHSPAALDPARLLRLCALVAIILVLGMLGAFLVTGIGQDPLQFVRQPEEYAAILLRDPPMLKLVIGLDNAFILFYGTMFLALGVLLLRQGASRALTMAAIALLSAAAILDLVENMHFLAMIGAAQRGMPPSADSIIGQVWESLTKFHISYIGLFLLGFLLPMQGWQGRTLCFLLRWVQWPVGMAIYVAPDALARPLVLVRFTFFLASLALLAMLYRPRADATDAPA